jgi:bilirubin oxidase
MPVPPDQRGKKDVVLVMPQDTVSFITQFETFADSTTPYMYHCHLLHHEDDGMMGSFTVYDSTIVSGIAEKLNTCTLHLYPNPLTGNNITLRHNLNPSQEYNVMITDVSGRIVFNTELSNSSNPLHFNITDLNTGIYYFTLTNKNERYHSRFIKIGQ